MTYELPEAVGEAEHLYELNDSWIKNLPIGTKFFTENQLRTEVKRIELEAIEKCARICESAGVPHPTYLAGLIRKLNNAELGVKQ